MSNGKIARLPHLVREEIHHRLREGQPGKQIIVWLNSMPEVKTVLAAAFGGQPVSPANLTQWKKRSHREWLLQQAALAQTEHFMAHSHQLAQAGEGALTDHLATFVATRYAVAFRQLAGETDERKHWKLLRAFCQDVTSLRRGDHYAESLRLQYQGLSMRLAGIPSHNPYDTHEVREPHS